MSGSGNAGPVQADASGFFRSTPTDGSLQMPVMGDPMKYINPYYTRQSEGDSLAPLAAFRQSLQGDRPSPMQGWTPYQAPMMPTITVNTAPQRRGADAMGNLLSQFGHGGYGGFDSSVGPGDDSATDASSIGAVNGHDAQSDAAGGGGVGGK